MRILICVGSNRRNGNTDRIVGLIAAELRSLADQHQAPLEVETLHLGSVEINPCRGCRACFDRGVDKCPLKDDLLEVKGKMVQADGLLVASPVYVDDVSGLTKNWIDRLAHVCHRPEFAGKCAYLVATTGSTPAGHALGTLFTALSTWGFHIAGQAGFKMGALTAPDQVESRHGPRARTVARQLFTAIHKKAAAYPSLRALAVFRIQQRYWQAAEQSSLDYRIWRERGWLDPRCSFYAPNKAGALKVALARLAGSAISGFVS